MIALTYLGLLGFMFFIEVIRKKNGKFDFLTIGHLMFALAYGIPGFLLESNFDNSSLEMTMDSLPYQANIQTIFAVFIGYFLVLIGFYSKTSVQFASRISIKSSNNKKILFYALGLLLLSSLAIFIYGSQYGGVINAMANITKIRTRSGVESGPFVFFKHFMYFSLFGSYLIGALAFSENRNKWYNFFLKSVFCLSVIMAFTASTLSGGRAILIYYFFGFYLVYVLKGGKTLNLATIPVFCFGALFLLYGKQFFWSLSGIEDGLDGVVNKFIESQNSKPSEEGFSIYRLMANFAFPIESLDTAFDKYYSPRFFVDWIYSLIYFIPERIFDIQKPETISILNTRHILGVKGEPVYEIPTGFLAFGVYSLFWPGLVIVTYCYGWLGNFLQSVLSRHMHDNIWIAYIYALTAQVWVDYQQSGDPRVFVMANFWFLTCTSILLFVVNKTSFVRPKNGKNTGRKNYAG